MPVPEHEFHVMPLSDGRIMSIVHDSTLKVLNLLDVLQKGIVRQVAFVESAEISLVNLVREVYHFKPNQFSLVIYVGRESSRIIFLRGNEIYSISNIIEAGLEFGNLSHTIYSRILLEQDKQEIPAVNTIILTGEAYEANLVKYLRDNLSGNVHVEYLNFEKFGVEGMEEVLSRFSVPIGAALRVLQNGSSDGYEVDLTPQQIRKTKNAWRKDLLLYTGLVALTLISLLGVLNIFSQQNQLSRLEDRIRFQQTELKELREMEDRLTAEKNKLANYDKALVIIDSLMVGANTWSDFLNNLSETTGKIDGIWITQMAPAGKSGKQVSLKGYSRNRDLIPQLTKAFTNATLKSANVKTVNNTRLIQFQIEVSINSF